MISSLRGTLQYGNAAARSDCHLLAGVIPYLGDTADCGTSVTMATG